MNRLSWKLMSLGKIFVAVVYFLTLLQILYYLTHFAPPIINPYTTVPTDANILQFILVARVTFFLGIARVGALIYIIYDIYHNKKIEKDKRVMWVLFLFLGNIVTVPYYWFKYLK